MMLRAPRFLILAAAALGIAGCAQPMPLGSVPAAERTAIEARLMQDIRTLASDEFGGRKPGTQGERLTTDFMVRELQAAGFESGTNTPASEWLAPVPLIATRPDTSRIEFKAGRRTVEYGTDSTLAVALTSRRRNQVEQADVVFVGKLGDEVADEAVAGKVVIMMGEPGVSPGKRAALFTKNPAAILTLIDDEEAIANIRRVFDRERIELMDDDAPRLSGYMARGVMADLMGEDAWKALLKQSEADGFEPVDFTFKATVEATSQRREVKSNNVIGKLAGAKPGSGAVLLLGHWDHLGECGAEDAEDRICNGAVDNASGIAVMLELARRLGSSGPFDRDIYVMGTSAEESGLLGARAFIDSPPIPLDTIVAAFNFDTIAIAPAGSKLGFVGEGETKLDALIRNAVTETGRELGDKEFANSFVRRQDGWALLQEGVPAVMLSSAFASEIVLGPFLSTHYHRASDEIETIELGGAIDDLLLHEVLVRRVSNTTLYPASND